MRQQTKNTILFIVLMVLCFFLWWGVKTWFFPTPPPPPSPPGPAAVNAALGSLGQAALDSAGKPVAEAKPPEKPAPPPVAPIPSSPLPREKALAALGASTAGLLASGQGLLAAASAVTPGRIGESFREMGELARDSKYHLYVKLLPRGAGVLRVVLNQFQQADALGRPMTLPDGSPKPMELVPEDPDNLSYLLFTYDVYDKDDRRPLDTLGRVEWQVDGPVTETLADGRHKQSVIFVSPSLKELHGLRVTKTFSLTEGDYHLGLEVKVERVDGDTTPVVFRYQMTGAHGLPIEGRWYTGTFRNCLIGQVEENKPDYNSRGVSRGGDGIQGLRQTSNWEGGNPVDRQQGYLIRYAGVAVQYFASVIVVDNDQKDQSYLAGARPTLETTVVKGVVESVDPNGHSFVLVRGDGTKKTFYIRPEDEDAEMRFLQDKGEGEFKEQGRIPFVALEPKQRLAVVSSSGPYDKVLDECPSFARQLRDDAMTQPLWEDDVTVRVSTVPTDVKKDQPLVHKYLLYNGPVKVMLLSQPETAADAVAPELVNRYLYDLNFNSLTDYQSSSVGWFTGPLGISYLLIQITNLMHTVLWFLHHTLFFPYILCIICLTLIVRGVMFPVSRKQALTSLKMQQLAPEMKKLQEKFKDDKQSLAAAQMEMYRKHGVNPFGTCWLLLLQMPIFMGLYYSLQESIHFRLAAVTSWWMPNLSAPDMLLWWSPHIPLISEPSWYGWLCYLGPYLNILPVLAVTLMLFQQKWTMPPPTDDTQAQQQKMMKYMMIFMGLMFYKVASGLCVYFIASSLWGFAERQFLPKKKPATAGGPPVEDKPEGGLLSRLIGPRAGNGTGVTTGPATGVSRKPDGEPRGGKGKRGKRRQESKARDRADGEGSMFQRLRDWWAGILEQARKK